MGNLSLEPKAGVMPKLLPPTNFKTFQLKTFTFIWKEADKVKILTIKKWSNTKKFIMQKHKEKIGQSQEKTRKILVKARSNFWDEI